LLKGNPDSVLKDPYSIVITEETANRYFASEDPIGKSLTVDNIYDYRITGVAKNVPGNSQIQFYFLASFVTLEQQSPEIKNHWGNHAFMTYVLLAKNTDCLKFTSKIKNIVIDKSADSATPVPLSLSLFSEIHLYEERAIVYVYIFSAIAFFTLLISIINYINLTTARSSDRLMEIGLRKVVGAHQVNLVNQFLTESIFLLFLAFFIALIIVFFTLPTFNAIVNKNLDLNLLGNKNLFLILTGTILFTGILSGSYPAFLMASFEPAKLIKKSIFFCNMVPKSLTFKRTLVIIQFTISIFLIISTSLILNQLHFIRDMDLGFDKQNLIYVPVKKNMVRKRSPLRNDLLRNPNVMNVTFASSLPSGVNNVADEIAWEGKDPNRKPLWRFVSTDYSYIKTLGLTIIEGRDFSERRPTDMRCTFIVNETALKRMGQKSPVGKPFSLWGTKGTLIGVVKDFHFSPLHNEIGPLLIFMNESIYNYMLIKIKPTTQKLTDTLEDIGSICIKHDSNFQFDYHFLDERFEYNYRAEQRMSEIFKTFTFLAICISCLGLFGLISFTAEQRKREIGIRKVIGASTPNIVTLLIKEYMLLIVISNIIAWPLAFLAMNNWLHNFAYRTYISVWIFILSATSSIVIALLTVSYQAIKAATANPVDSLMCE
jgi:ABC-type antimicrobial peptide transport system permease subunit